LKVPALYVLSLKLTTISFFPMSTIEGCLAGFHF
jgi:hypothetical protein